MKLVRARADRVPSSIPFGPRLGPSWAKLGPKWAPDGPDWGPFGNAAWGVQQTRVARTHRAAVTHLPSLVRPPQVALKQGRCVILLIRWRLHILLREAVGVIHGRGVDHLDWSLGEAGQGEGRQGVQQARVAQTHRAAVTHLTSLVRPPQVALKQRGVLTMCRLHVVVVFFSFFFHFFFFIFFF